MLKKLNINCYIYDNDYQSHIINSNYIICRAFKKMAEIMAFSRENVDLSHKLIILKGKECLKLKQIKLLRIKHLSID